MDWFVAEQSGLARELFQHALAAVYLVAFVAAARQYRPLLGEHGLTPAARYVRTCSFRQAPGLFQWHHSDRFFLLLAWAGAALSLATVAGLTEVVPWPVAMCLWALLWFGYLSIVNVGQQWYRFGWESLLLETGSLAIFLGNDEVAPPLLTLVLLWWLLFRLEFGAGLIKLRGDPCWRDLTCLEYHHETQPMPGPFSRSFHHLPRSLHRVETAANHVAQLVVPVGLFLPQPVAGVAAVLLVLTQLWLVASGNFAWLNWLALVLAFSALPDRWLAPRLPGDGRTAGTVGTAEAATPLPFVVLVCLATAAVVVLSWWPVRNMLSSGQAMNAAFNRWHLVNTYGAFGHVTKTRYEVVLEGTRAERPDEEAAWHEYEFRGKPGDPARRPRQFAPYHLRLDWLMWFAALSRSFADPWFDRLVERLLAGDREVRGLLRHDPFGDDPPTYVRARYYRYRFTTRAERRRTGHWWSRVLVGEYRSPVRLSPG